LSYIVVPEAQTATATPQLQLIIGNRNFK